MPIVNGLQTRVNRRGENLSGANLRGENLTRTDFRGAIFTGADLTGADLRFSAFDGADLTDAVLTNANLTNADLVGAIRNNSELIRKYSIVGVPDAAIPLALEITNHDGDGYDENNYVDNFQWQELINGYWSDIVSATEIYYTPNYGQDQTISALITYTDAEGFSQTVRSISKSFTLKNLIESSSSEIINLDSSGIAVADSEGQQTVILDSSPKEDDQNNLDTSAISMRASQEISTFKIIGTAKVGETMTVGYNLTETAVDADNSGNVLDGSYSYDWQLSGDGGSNWTTVATNADYKITTADVDKKLRALVTYTDDGGTPIQI